MISLSSSDLQARNPSADVAETVFNYERHLQKPQKIKLQLIANGGKTTSQIASNCMYTIPNPSNIATIHVKRFGLLQLVQEIKD
jgi:hypothetical protein